MTVLQRQRNKVIANYSNCDWAELPENDLNKIRDGLGIDLAEVDRELEFYRYRITQATSGFISRAKRSYLTTLG